jgi:hypothetical protein
MKPDAGGAADFLSRNAEKLQSFGMLTKRGRPETFRTAPFCVRKKILLLSYTESGPSFPQQQGGERFMPIIL